MRSVVLLLPMIAMVAKSQETWSYIQEVPGFDAFVTDVVVSGQGSSLCGYYHDNGQAGSIVVGYLARIDLQGQPLYLRQLGNARHSMLPGALLQGTDDRLHAVGPYKDQGPVDTIPGFFHVDWPIDGDVTDSAIFALPEFTATSMRNAVITSTGSIILGGSVRTPPFPVYGYTKLLQIDQNGEYLNSVLFGTPDFFQYGVTASITLVAPGFVVAVEKTYMVQADYYHYTEDLNLIGQWTEQSPNPDPLNPNDSIMRGALDLRPLGHGEYIVGGYINVPNVGQRSALFRMDETGSILDQFVLSGANPKDHSALAQTIAAIDDSSFYFLAWRNVSGAGGFGTGAPPPTEPSELHIYKMDNDLNVLCDYVVDGSEDSTYYVPFRIKTTPDGGFVLVGGRKDLTEVNSHYKAWAQKFDPLVCTVGIGKQNIGDQVLVFPNPGNGSFTALLNGPVTNATLQLYNATGELVATAKMRQGQASVETLRLAPGLYLYRILDSKGYLRANGKWVKE